MQPYFSDASNEDTSAGTQAELIKTEGLVKALAARPDTYAPFVSNPRSGPRSLQNASSICSVQLAKGRLRTLGKARSLRS